MKKIYFNSETIVAFHIGRGGRFNNPGHLSFVGEHKIGDFTDNLWSPTIIDENAEDGYIDDERPEAEWTCESGDSVGLTNAMVASGIGRIEYDGEYDTTYTMYLKDVEQDSREWDAIFATKWIDAEDAKMYLCPILAVESVEDLAEYINEHEDWDLKVSEVIERNGWKDETDEQYGVCYDEYEEKRVVLDENGKAQVIDVEE